MGASTLKRQISAFFFLSISFREEVENSSPEAVSRDKRQLDVHCIMEGRERIPLPPHVKSQTWDENMCLASSLGCGEKKPLSGKINVQSRKTCFVVAAGKAVIHQIKNFLQKRGIFNKTSPRNSSAIGRKPNPGQDTIQSPVLRQQQWV